MSASRDPDGLIRSFLLQGEELLSDPIYDAVRAEIDQKRQLTVAGPWRTSLMNRSVTRGLGAAAVAIIGLFLGYQFLATPAGTSGPSGPVATPTASSQPSSHTLASGSFTASLGEFGQAFDIHATGTGDDASGTMEISNPAGGEGAYSVDVQCARTTDKGFLLIGGQVTESTYQEFIKDGAYVMIVLAPGTPVRMLWAADVLATDEVPAPAESCAAYLDSQLSENAQFIDAVAIQGRPIDGNLDLGE